MNASENQSNPRYDKLEADGGLDYKLKAKKEGFVIMWNKTTMQHLMTDESRAAFFATITSNVTKVIAPTTVHDHNIGAPEDFAADTWSGDDESDG